MKILIMGLPGSGKTTLARALAERLGAVWWNADEVRNTINKHLGFGLNDRLQQARTMGWISEQVSKAGNIAVADFVCPTPEAREAYCESGQPDILIWTNNINAGRFEDTNLIFVPPEKPDIIIDYFDIIPEQREKQTPDKVTLIMALNEITALVEEKINAGNKQSRDKEDISLCWRCNYQEQATLNGLCHECMALSLMRRKN